MAKERAAPQAEIPFAQIAALVLQGGGALGAYEHGVVRRLFEEPNLDIRYVSGVSIGAISAAIVVGARNGDPVASLEALWDDLAIDAPFLPPALAAGLSNLGNAAFYRLRSDVFGLPFWTSFYDLTPIRRRLAALVDFDRIRRQFRQAGGDRHQHRDRRDRRILQC